MSRMLEALKRIESVTEHEEPDVVERIDELVTTVAEELESEDEPEVTEPDVVSFVQNVTDVSREECELVVPTPAVPAPANYRYFRDLADNVLSSCEPDRASVVLFAAIDFEEGSQSIVGLLSRVLAERADGDVAVVDFNFDRPELAKRLSIQPEFGLSDVLSGKASCAEAICEAGTDGLFVLSGVNPLDVARQRGGDFDMRPVLDELRRDYSVVLLSAASPSTSEVTRAARLCDGVYLIVRMGITARRAAQRAIRHIERRGGRVLGCVLTDV